MEELLEDSLSPEPFEVKIHIDFDGKVSLQLINSIHTTEVDQARQIGSDSKNSDAVDVSNDPARER
jgi:hypothetical protein